MLGQLLLSLISFLIVGFGQPAWSPILGLVASAVGFSLFFKVLLSIPNFRQRFRTAYAWFFCVHALHLYWMTSHPFLYIYVVIFLFSGLKALQFGIVSYWLRPAIIEKPLNLFALASLWTFFEWSWLYFLGGYSLNQSGIALSGSLYAMQLASIGGTFILTFWVWLVNLFFVRSWILHFSRRSLTLWGAALLLPYLFGLFHIQWHRSQMEAASSINVVVVNTDFPVDSHPRFQSAEEARYDVLRKWGAIFKSLKEHKEKPVDLVVLPECSVCYGTYLPVFPIDEVQRVLGQDPGFFPPLFEPYAVTFGKSYLLTNAFFAQAISNLFKSDVVIGLEDEEILTFNIKEHYNAAHFFTPRYEEAKRYEKRILVPLGEYVPTAYLNNLLSNYGTPASFSHGKEAKVFQGKVPFGVSICYEETCGTMMRENRLLGADLLVNLTNDGWFPDSLLAKSHFDHARLRTVENGIPLVRSCNDGISGAVNSLGEIVAIIGDEPKDDKVECSSLYVEVPSYHYKTLYSLWGDNFILGICFFSFLGAVIRSKRD